MCVGVLTASSRIDEPPVTIRRGDAIGVDASDSQAAGSCGKILHGRGIDESLAAAQTAVSYEAHGYVRVSRNWLPQVVGAGVH